MSDVIMCVCGGTRHRQLEKQVESLQEQLTEALKPRVCRWPSTVLVNGRAENGGKASCEYIITTSDRRAGGAFCNHCGGKVSVCDE